jgi:hypothetical protein
VSEETKESIIIAGVMTAVIMILLIMFGNTGSGFFRNLMVFIIGTIVGTPLSIIGRFIGKWFSRIFMPQYELFNTYLGFAFGALLGGAVGVALFSNKVETSFIYGCVKNQGLNKSQCQCIYDKLDDKYDVKDFLEGKYNQDDKFKTFYLKINKKCIIENKSINFTFLLIPTLLRWNKITIKNLTLF